MYGIYANIGGITVFNQDIPNTSPIKLQQNRHDTQAGQDPPDPIAGDLQLGQLHPGQLVQDLSITGHLSGAPVR